MKATSISDTLVPRTRGAAAAQRILLRYCIFTRLAAEMLTSYEHYNQ